MLPTVVNEMILELVKGIFRRTTDGSESSKNTEDGMSKTRDDWNVVDQWSGKQSQKQPKNGKPFSLVGDDEEETDDGNNDGHGDDRDGAAEDDAKGSDDGAEEEGDAEGGDETEDQGEAADGEEPAEGSDG